MPLLGVAFCWLSNQYNRYVLAQDKRIVLRQRPLRTDPHMGEILVTGDKPIVWWRRWVAANSTTADP